LVFNKVAADVLGQNGKRTAIFSALNVGLLEADIRLIWVPFRESDYNEAALWYCVLSSPPYLEVC
jgi:hypothetical protein